MQKNILTVLMSLLSLFPILSPAEPPSIPDVVFVSLPGGAFQMGDERGDLWNTCRPVHTVTVSAFRMSETEITNAQYCVFLNAARARKDIAVSKSVVRGAKGAYRGENYIHL
ncbi:MAG: formylglycine-generating enzyme family protein, partial [Candidatus Latescibacterota bacterium]